MKLVGRCEVDIFVFVIRCDMVNVLVAVCQPFENVEMEDLSHGTT